MTPYRSSEYATLSDKGRVRDHNEDSILAEPPLFVVADGLGGHEAGEVASSIAVETLRDNAPRKPDAKALARAVRSANREVIRAAREGIGRSGMGTTLTAALVEGRQIVLAQVGDSRAYLLSGGSIRQVTEDHSMVADMVRRGAITEEESRYHPNRSVITRALGTDPNMVADTYEITAEDGDVLLLCSDGLSGMLEDPDIVQVVSRAEGDLHAAAQALIDAANAAGGHDNISAVLVRISESGLQQAATTATRRSRAWIAVVVWLVAFALIVGGIGYATYRYAASRAFLVAEDGVVVVYRGVPGSFAGLQLSWLVEQTDIPVDGLKPARAADLRAGIPVESLAEAEALVALYRSELTTISPSTPPALEPPAPASP